MMCRRKRGFPGGGAVLWLCALFAGTLLRLPKGLLWTVLILVILFAGACGFYVTRAAIEGNRTPEPGADYLILLGAKVNGTSPSLAFSWRITSAIDYLKANPDTVAVVTGGQGADEGRAEALGYTHADYMGAKSLEILLPHYYVREFAAYVKESLSGHFE